MGQGAAGKPKQTVKVLWFAKHQNHAPIQGSAPAQVPLIDDVHPSRLGGDKAPA